MRSSFVHRFQERIQPFGKCDIATAAAEPSRFLEIGLGESANRTARARTAFLDFLRRADTEQQVRQRETGRVLHPLFLRAAFAKIHLLHFPIHNLRQENRRIVTFANVTQHFYLIRPSSGPNIQPRNLCLSISRAEWPWESSGINRRAAFTRDLAETGDHPQADRTRFSRPDHPPVCLDHRNHFRSRAAEKAFVCNKNVMPADISLGNSYSELRRDFEYDRSGDSA